MKDSILAACEERAGDRTQLLVAADYFAEAGDPKWEQVMRWMAEYDKRPLPPTKTESYWMWTCYGGLCGPRFGNGVAHTLPRAVCKRIGFWEWQCYQSWTEAVEVLAAALEQGWVECVGDPTKVDAESEAELDKQAEELINQLRAIGQ